MDDFATFKPLQFQPIQHAQIGSMGKGLGETLGQLGAQAINKGNAKPAGPTKATRPRRVFPNAQQAQQLDENVGVGAGY